MNMLTDGMKLDESRIYIFVKKQLAWNGAYEQRIMDFLLQDTIKIIMSMIDKISAIGSNNIHCFW